MGFYWAFVVMISIQVVHGTSDSLMQCSKYHFEEKVLEKLIRLEFKIENHEKTIAKWIEKLGVGLGEIEKLKQTTKSFTKVQKTEFDNVKEQFKQSLRKMEEAAENLKNETVNRINSYDELIETKLGQMTISDKNSALAFLRSSFDSTANSLKGNISTVLTKQTTLQEDLDGMKRKLNKPNIAFSAYLSSTYTNTDTVKFNKVWTNVGNAYNSTTGVFTAPIPGYYSFTAVLLSEYSRSLFRHIWRNKERLAGTYVTDKGYKSGTLAVNLEVKKGDEVYIKSKSSSFGGVYSDTDKYSTFSGYFIG